MQLRRRSFCNEVVVQFVELNGGPPLCGFYLGAKILSCSCRLGARNWNQGDETSRFETHLGSKLRAILHIRNPLLPHSLFLRDSMENCHGSRNRKRR